MLYLKIIVFHLIFTFSFNTVLLIELKTRNLFALHQWKEMDFEFPYEIDREFAVKNGIYLKGAGIPIDFDFEYFKELNSTYRIFVTLPRLTLGIPYTLGIVKKNVGENNTHLLPYPDYSTHVRHGAGCGGITSAIRIFIDEMKRLWVIDSGQIASVQFCPPQLLAFDLETDRLIQRYVIPRSQFIPGISVFTSLVVDCRDFDSTACKYTMIYIADSWGFGLIVYDVVQNTSWRIEHTLMRPESQLHRDGIFAISLSPKNEKERSLLFHTLGSKNEVSVPLRVIDDRFRWISKSENTSTLSDFKNLGSRGIPCESEVMDDSGNLYCSVLSLNALIRWDSRKIEYNSDNLRIYAYNPEQIKFVTGMKVIKNSHGENELWILSTEPKVFYGGMFEENEIKFRLIGCRISDFLTGRKCTVGAS
ncbi:protein yellow [Eupeodes corollae]|uniref:protein yellow n=1 Tax=Eupeodes corollae TaxID=290404 RepID=UPI00249060CE|nr:protein yellow [Eupeodes corollae]